VEFSWGATEAKVGAGIVDAIVELTETGASLRANNLRIIDTVCESTTVIVANKDSWANKWKKEKIGSIALLLKGALAAEEKVGLKMNVEKKNLKKVISILPAMKKPTISHLSDEGWCALETIVDEKIVRNIIPQLKQNGAQGIIEYPLNKVIS
jgi:ATP phosphoribosyltransferase